MTIERMGSVVTIICDTCGDEFTGDPGDEFAEVWSAAKREGWKVRKIAGEWMHGCHKSGCTPT